MFEVLIFLALIPLALGGAVIVGAAVWLLLPVAMLLGGAGLAIIMYRDPAMHSYHYWPALVAVLGFFWLSSRVKR